MKTIVLDDDPTGTQAACGVTVLLAWTAETIRAALAEADTVYLQTNSRALAETEAVELVERIRREVAEALPGEEVQFVLRGDSTLRGHVFAETEAFLDGDDTMVFVPAFPRGGRTTVDAQHWVEIGGERVAAADTEYARDPVFPFASSDLLEYVREKSERTPSAIRLDVVHRGAEAIAEALLQAPPAAVVVVDAAEDGDVVAIAGGIRAAREAGRRLVVRCAAPLAAQLGGVASDGLLTPPLAHGDGPVLVVCGSHTAGATAQLQRLTDAFGKPVVIPTEAALADPRGAGAAAARTAATVLVEKELVVVSSERTRLGAHNTLDHGARVMEALVEAARETSRQTPVVVAKGGITSAEIARSALGATSAFVIGQLLPGVSVWRLVADTGREVLYVVVPGNVGGADTLLEVVDRIGVVRPGAVLEGT